jgi:predicted RNase H-like HicB family nuclease
MDSYIAYLRKDKDSDFGVEFPDLPGCVTAGRTLEEAKAMAAEALTFHVAMLLSEKMPVPPPSALDHVAGDPHRGDAILLMVDLDPELAKSERVNVMIPRHLLGRIDAAFQGNRSRFLVEAAEKKLAG